MTATLQRVLLFAPRGRDANVLGKVFRARGIETLACASYEQLLNELRIGAAAAVATDEALDTVSSKAMDEWLAQQPQWSDFPFVVLSAKHKPRGTDEVDRLKALGNVVLLERPVSIEILVRATEAALRARKRQYQTRDHLHELDVTHATVERLNRDLETRISERTRELAAANDRLMAEIAERERAQSALVQVQKLEAVGRLTGGIAHDFNNLLQVVSMNLELLSRRHVDSATGAVVDRAKRAIGRGSKLTAQLLSFARVQSLVAKVFDLRVLLTDMHELIGVSVGSAVTVEYDLAPEPMWARLDAGQFEMALLNLAVNAKDAMGGSGVLKVSARIAEGEQADDGARQVVVAVEDNGEGIAPHLLTKVFEPFFTTKPVGSGTGLGLSQVYGFARQSGGNARIASTLREGTRVEMVFPCVEPDVGASQAMEMAAGGVTTPRSILVIEDDAEVRRVIVDSLELSGHSVAAAANGIEGLALLDDVHPDLLIVDYAMPMMTGAEVIQQAHVRRPDLPIVLATGYADMVEVGRVMGTQSILVKPFDIAALQHAVAVATMGLAPDARREAT